MTDKLRTYGRLLGGRDYRLLFAGQAISQLGDWMSRIGLLVLAYRLTGTGLAVALIMLAQVLPRVFVSPIGGLLADRYPKRRMMIALDLGRAALAGSLVLADSPGGLWVAGAAVILLHGLSAIFNPVRSAALPALVPPAGLGTANALNDVSGQAAFFLGPALGAAIVAAWGINAVFLLNMATFLVSALLIGLMRLHEPATRTRARGTVLHELREGWAVMSGHALLRFVLGGLFLQAIVAIGLTVLLLPLLTGPLGQADDRLGVLLTIVGLGTIAGAPLGLWLFGRYPPLPLAACATFGIVLSMATVGTANGLAFVALALLLNGLLTGVADLVTVSTVQRAVPGDRLGRAFGFMFWILALGQVFGALVGSAFLHFFGPTQAILALSGVCLIIGIGLLLPNVGSLRPPLIAELPEGA